MGSDLFLKSPVLACLALSWPLISLIYPFSQSECTFLNLFKPFFFKLFFSSLLQLLGWLNFHLFFFYNFPSHHNYLGKKKKNGQDLGFRDIFFPSYFIFQMPDFLKTNLILVIWVEKLLSIGVIKKGNCYFTLVCNFR